MTLHQGIAAKESGGLRVIHAQAAQERVGRVAGAAQVRAIEGVLVEFEGVDLLLQGLGRDGLGDFAHRQRRRVGGQGHDGRGERIGSATEEEQGQHQREDAARVLTHHAVRSVQQLSEGDGQCGLQGHVPIRFGMSGPGQARRAAGAT